MSIIELIDKKRRGKVHTEAEIHQLVSALMTGEAADYQISAWLMAACIQGLNLDETTWLTDAYVKSGEQLDLSSVSGVVVDKHSTGGVGDKVSLVLVPMLAACGVKVLKLAGRGLGFTGGTVDKLEVIPGIQTVLPQNRFLTQLNLVGAVVSAQTAQLTPADGRIYALRDVTATVDHIPLIAASVVSKKIATGAPYIVLDIKCGPGAFMKTLDDAKALAHTCREVGQRLNVSISTVISAMEQPLGYAVGHTLEVMETLETLKGQGPEDLVSLCVRLGTSLLISAGVEETEESAEARLRETLTSGKALKKFYEWIAAQDGDISVLDEPALMPQPQRISIIPAPCSGYVQHIDPIAVAQAVKIMGGGRSRKEDILDLGVGVQLRKKVGDRVEEGETLLELHVGSHDMDHALKLAQSAFTLGELPVECPALVLEVFTQPAPQSVMA